jgi:hypothetical protein
VGFDALAPRRQLLGRGHVGQRILVLGTDLFDLERRGEIEDRLAVLNGHDATSGERPAVADAIDVEDDRDIRVAGTQKVRMQGVDESIGLDSAPRSRQCLRRDLTAEHALTVLVGAEPAKQVDLEHLQLEELEQRVECGSHQPKNTAACS